MAYHGVSLATRTKIKQPEHIHGILYAPEDERKKEKETENRKQKHEDRRKYLVLITTTSTITVQYYFSP